MITAEMNSCMEKIVVKAIKECSMHYGFNSDEAMFRLGLKECLKDECLKDEDECLKEEVKVVVEKSSKKKKIVLPYSGEYDNSCCSGLELNHGLYTQCLKKKKVNDLCEGCNKQALKNTHGKPDYGRIEERQEQGLMEFRDPKGKSPVSYIKVMKKLGFSKEEVLEEAEKKNKRMDEIHFLEEEDKNNKKGRPKKSKKELEVEGETNDLFAELVASSIEIPLKTPSTSPVVSSKKLATTPRLEEKEEIPKEKPVKEKVVKEKKEKPVKEKVVKEKAVKEKAVKEKVVEESPKEKPVKEKAVKEKVVKEKVVKEPKEKKEKPVKEKVVKEVENNSEPSTSSDKEEVEEDEIKEEVEEADVVKRFEHEGIKYLKSKKTGIIYNMEQEVIGKWNEELQKIDFNEATEEEEEEEYDE